MEQFIYYMTILLRKSELTLLNKVSRINVLNLNLATIQPR